MGEDGGYAPRPIPGAPFSRGGRGRRDAARSRGGFETRPYEWGRFARAASSGDRVLFAGTRLGAEMACPRPFPGPPLSRGGRGRGGGTMGGGVIRRKAGAGLKPAPTSGGGSRGRRVRGIASYLLVHDWERRWPAHGPSLGPRFRGGDGGGRGGGVMRREAGAGLKPAPTSGGGSRGRRVRGIASYLLVHDWERRWPLTHSWAPAFAGVTG